MSEILPFDEVVPAPFRRKVLWIDDGMAGTPVLTGVSECFGEAIQQPIRRIPSEGCCSGCLTAYVIIREAGNVPQVVHAATCELLLIALGSRETRTALLARVGGQSGHVSRGMDLPGPDGGLTDWRGMPLLRARLSS